MSEYQLVEWNDSLGTARTTQPKPGFPGSPEYDRLYRRFREAQEWYDREWADGNTTRAANALELQNDILSELARLQNG